MKRRRVTIHLDRGLGNQLFTFHAGMALAVRSQSSVVVDTSGQYAEQKLLKSSILDFSITAEGSAPPITWRRTPPRPARDTWLRGVHWGAHWGARRSRFLAGKIGQYRSLVYGYDPQLFGVHIPTRLWGNFQTWYYAQYLLDSGCRLDFSVRNPSAWFLRELETLAGGSWVGVHLRRGDYWKYQSTMGVLSSEYALKALAIAMERHHSDSVAIFSDDEQAAFDFAERALTSAIGPAAKQIRVVEAPQESTSAESLTLLAQCGAIVMSNSSWSWWAGWLAGKDALVIYPDPYFRDFGQEFLLHFPHHWVAVGSEFV